MKSSVKAGIKENKYIVIMDKEIDNLRRKIWRLLFQERGNLSDCDVAMALCMVHYELVHHSDEKK